MLVHAVQNPGGYGRNVATESWNRVMSSVLAYAEERIQEIADRFEERGFATTLILRQGSAASTILEAAEEHRPDAVVMRTEEHSAIARLFLGSTARRVVQKSDCPVLTVRWSPEHT